MQEQNKTSFPQAAAICPLDPSVLTSPSLASSLTAANIEVVIQQALSRTSTALSVTSGKQPWFSNGDCCGESGFDSGFLMVGVGLVVVADGSGCDSGFWFLRFLMMGGGLPVSDGGGGG